MEQNKSKGGNKMQSLILIVGLGIISFWLIFMVNGVTTAYKNQQVVTFIPEKGEGIRQSALTSNTMGSVARRLATVLPKGRYIINAPVGYFVVGSNVIEVTDEQTCVTMQNAEGKHLFAYVSANEE